MHRVLLGALALLLALGTNVDAVVNAPVRILIDGRPVERMTALSHGGAVYVELGGMVRAFSGLVIFDKATATVSIGSRVAIFTLGSGRANLDGQVVAIGGKAFEDGGDFYVPLSFVATRVARARVHIAQSGTLAMITSVNAPPVAPVAPMPSNT